MRMPMLSRVIYCVVAVYLAVGSHVADYSSTHLFNPRWPPHAKFHTGQTLMFSIFLAVLTWYFALRKTKDKTLTLVGAAAGAGGYWITQALAICYPNTAFLDPEIDNPDHRLLGLPAQLVVDVIGLSLTFAATAYAARKGARWTSGDTLPASTIARPEKA